MTPGGPDHCLGTPITPSSQCQMSRGTRGHAWMATKATSQHQMLVDNHQSTRAFSNPHQHPYLPPCHSRPRTPQQRAHSLSALSCHMHANPLCTATPTPVSLPLSFPLFCCPLTHLHIHAHSCLFPPLPNNKTGRGTRNSSEHAWPHNCHITMM